MNAIDLVVCLLLLLALWHGWKQGFIVQVCSLAGILAGIWLASRYGAVVGGWLRLDEQFAAAGGFIALFVVVLIVVAILARLLRRLFRFAGLGAADVLLGVVVSLAKCLLALGVLFAAFDRLNGQYALVEERTLEQSISYQPVMHLSESLLPFVERAFGEGATPSDANHGDDATH